MEVFQTCKNQNLQCLTNSMTFSSRDNKLLTLIHKLNVKRINIYHKSSGANNINKHHISVNWSSITVIILKK